MLHGNHCFPTQKGRGVFLVVIFAITYLLPRAQAADSEMEPRPELVLQSAHSSVVTGVVFSPSGDLIASVSNDGTLKIWGLPEGYLLETVDVPDVVSKGLPPNSPALRSLGGLSNVAFRTDGKAVFTTDGSGVISWAGEKLKGFRQPGISEGGLVVDPSGRWIAVSSVQGVITILDPSDLHVLRVLDNHSGSILAIAAAPHGERLISGGTDRNVTLWDPLGGKRLKVFRGHTDYIRALAFSGDGQAAVSVSDDKTIKVWSIESGTLKNTLLSDSEVQSVAVSPDGRRIATAGENYEVKLWDVDSGQTVKVWKIAGSLRFLDFQDRHMHQVKWYSGGLAFSPDSQFLAVGGFGQVQVFDMKTMSLSLTLGYNANTRTARFSPQGQYLAVANIADIKLWDLKSGVPRFVWSLPNDRPGSFEVLGLGRPFDFSPDGKLLSAAYKSGLVRIWKLANGEMIREFQTTPDVRDLAFGPDSIQLATASASGTVNIWNALSGDQLKTISISLNGGVPSLIFHPDGRRLATASSRGDAISIWDVATGQKVKDLDCLPPPELVTRLRQVKGASGPCGVNRLSVDYLSGTLVAAGNFGARLWSGPDWGRVDQRFEGDVVGGTAISARGRFWVWGGSVWDLSERKELLNLATRQGSPAFSPDSKWLVSAGRGEVKLSDLMNGQTAAYLVSLPYGNWLVFTPDGLFDGSNAAWSDITWRFGRKLWDVLPVETFFRDFFQPGLLADIVAGKRPRAAQNLAQVDRRQPVVKLRLSDPSIDKAVHCRTITLSLEVEHAPPDDKHRYPSGARDLRLFHNGTLVKIWHGEAGDKAQYQIKVPIIAGTNAFSAFAYNDSNVRGRFARLTVVGDKSLERKGTLYILAIGINEYSNGNYNLRYAKQDAQAFSEELKKRQEQLDTFSQVDVVPLFDQDATKRNILAALHALAGDAEPLTNPGTPQALRHLAPANPEDAVFVYFAGHGTSAKSHFYMIPYDLGYAGDRDALDERNLVTILEHGISDEELLEAYERIDAGRLVMVIDACNSGQALESEEKRRGPMNSKGLAQLAYEKGMYLLTASESYQDALEDAQLGHGLLTYALVEEGLKKNKADVNPKDGKVDIREWLDYAAQRVPEIQQSMVASSPLVEHGSDPKTDAKLPTNQQQPRVFYRREREANPLVITKVLGQTTGGETTIQP